LAEKHGILFTGLLIKGLSSFCKKSGRRKRLGTGKISSGIRV
jgi:hypothetical protein